MPAQARVRATLFNGPRKRGKPTVVGHTFTACPPPGAYVAVIPIKKLNGGPYSYRATFDVPKLAADGVLTHIDGRIGRRYEFKGSERSYVSSRCTDRDHPHPRPLPLRGRDDHGRDAGKALHPRSLLP